jgi:hypothetical protein
MGEEFPKIKELNRNSQKEYRPRDQQEQYSPRQAAPAGKSNAFVSKWKPEGEDVFEPRQAPPKRADFEPAAKPKIIEVEEINETGERSPRAGRRIRSRSGER